MQFYQNFGELKCLQGDTLDAFRITLFDEEGEAIDTAGYSMRLILEKKATPGGIVLQKACTAADSFFQVQLTSEDTETLSGVYQVYFYVTDSGSLKYKKLTGMLNVVPVPLGG